MERYIYIYMSSIHLTESVYYLHSPYYLFYTPYNINLYHTNNIPSQSKQKVSIYQMDLGENSILTTRGPYNMSHDLHPTCLQNAISSMPSGWSSASILCWNKSWQNLPTGCNISWPQTWCLMLPASENTQVVNILQGLNIPITGSLCFN